VINELEICGRKWSWLNVGYSDLHGSSEEQKPSVTLDYLLGEI
jgi:hypothetical protein